MEIEDYRALRPPEVPKVPATEVQPISKAPRYRWAILIISIGAFMGSFGFANAVTAPVIPALVHEFNLSPSISGVLMTVMVIGDLCMSIPAGLMADRWGVRRAGSLGLAVVAIGFGGMSLAPNLTALLIGRGIVGVGGQLVTIATVVALAQWFSKEQLGLPMGIMSAAMPLSVSWGTPLAGAIISSNGWREGFLAGGILSVVCFSTYALVIKRGPYLARQRSHLGLDEAKSASEVRGNPLRDHNLWKFGVGCFFASWPQMTIMVFYVTWLMRAKGISSLAQASDITGLIGLAGIVGALGAGYLSDKIGRRKPVYIIACIWLAVAMLLLAVLPESEAVLVGMTLLIGMPPYMIVSTTFAITPFLTSNESSGTAFGVVLVCVMFAGMIGSPVIGYIFGTWGLLATMIAEASSALIGAAIVLNVKAN